MFTFVILQERDIPDADKDYIYELEYAGHVPRIVLELADVLKWDLKIKEGVSNQELVLGNWRKDTKAKLVRLLKDEERKLSDEEFAVAVKQLSILCRGELTLADDYWVATDLSWSCLKSNTFNHRFERVHTVTAVSPLARDAVEAYLDSSDKVLGEVVSMDSLNLANNSAGQKARYFP